MDKVFQVAKREFLATVATKGFIIGVLVTPLLIMVAVVLMPLLMNKEAPRIEGEVAVIDPTGAVTERLRDYLQPESIAARRDDFRKLADEQTPEALKQLSGASGQDESTRLALDAILGKVPNLQVKALPPDADLDGAKAPLAAGGPSDGGRLAVVVVHEDAVERREGEPQFGSYDLFVRKIDDRIEDEIQDGMREAIIDARVRVAGADRAEIEALTRVRRARSTTVTLEGESKTNEALNLLLPAGFMVLLLVSVFTGGQYIMTTTIEEKSSRVVEVLLSAVSPMELMTGKILGQMAVSFVILALYAAMGVSGLVAFAVLGMVDMWLLLYLLIFYLIAYVVIASIMAAIGAAVNEMREAQTLMTPVMLTVMIPWILWLPITRDPNSLFATLMSFIPPVNSFVTLLRMASSSPPPMWQVWLSIAIGVASAYAALWFAAKVFRIGLLMYGKPPSFATLIRWVKMA